VDFFILIKVIRPFKRALDALIIDLFIDYLKENSLNNFILYIAIKFAVYLAFIRRFKGIINKLFKRLNKERLKIFIIIIIIIIVFKSSLI
jgi:hypothetical protein